MKTKYDKAVTGCKTPDYDCPCNGCDYRELRYECARFRRENGFELVREKSKK